MFLKRTLAGLFLLLVWPWSTAQADQAFDKGLLWRVERDGVATSYLFGTMHVTDERVLDVPDAVASALASSDTAVFELLLTPEVQLALVQHMMFTDGTRLANLTGDELFETTSDVARDYGLFPMVLNMMKPWALVALFSAPPEETMRQSKGEPVLDIWLQDEARRQGKVLLALEEPDEQIAALEGMTTDDQINLLRATVENKDMVDQTFAETLQFYLDRDLDGLAGLMAPDPEMDLDVAVLESFNERLILTRNDTMAERLMPILEGGGVFAAVGALHLPGDNGLLQQLSNAGYEVTAVY
jgi:uncharacterized protein YbaP (TraB family)